jgi:hypothetical protein
MIATQTTTQTTTPATAQTTTTVGAAPSTQVVPGAHQDGADLYGIVLALVIIVGVIGAVRLIFRRR